MKIKEMFAVEYKSADNRQTYEIFSTFMKAVNYVENIKSISKEYKPLYIFKADFNMERIYKDVDNWNYDDYSDTYIWNSVKILHKYN